jgi:hypothetical protein
MLGGFADDRSSKHFAAGSASYSEDAETIPWNDDTTVRRAGISKFATI